MAARRETDGKKEKPWAKRAARMKQEGKCYTCAVDKDFGKLWRTLDSEQCKDTLDFILQMKEDAELAEAKVKEVTAEVEESESVLPEAESEGDPFKGRVGETPSVVDAVVEQTQVEESAREKRNRERREKRAAAKVEA